MHTKKGTFNTFFTALQYYNPKDVAKLFTQRMSGKKADIGFLNHFFENSNCLLENYNSFIIINDSRRAQILYVSPSVYIVTGYKQDEFLSGGTALFFKNYCPADRLNGMKILEKISSHQKQPIKDKDLYQYQTTFRFLHKNGYYKWMHSRLMFVSHDEKEYPWISISIVSTMENFKVNDSMNFARLKFNNKMGQYETEFIEEYQPEYLNILNPTDLKILKLLALGMDNHQIANQLKYSEHTIKDYRKKMLKKTWCENLIELLTFALKNGLIS